MPLRFRSLLPLFAALVTLACQPAPPAASAAPSAAPDSPDAAVSEPWIRQPPAGMTMTSAYLTIQNPSTEALRLEAVTIDGVGVTEMHSMSMQDGMMRMRKVESIDIAVGEELRFEPGGWHLMLMGLEQDWSAGQTVPATLRFANGQTREVRFKVRALQ